VKKTAAIACLALGASLLVNAASPGGGGREGGESAGAPGPGGQALHRAQRGPRPHRHELDVALARDGGRHQRHLQNLHTEQDISLMNRCSVVLTGKDQQLAVPRRRVRSRLREANRCVHYVSCFGRQWPTSVPRVDSVRSRH